MPRETPETYLDSVDWLVKNWQGQAVTSWYLDLPDINDPYSNLSEFSINLTKYGLRRTKVIEEKKKHSNHHFFPDIKMSHIWEHDTMTQYKAMDLVNDFLSNYYNRKYFAATGFSMTTGLIQCQTNDAKIPLSTIKWFNDEHVNINIFLNNYKLQKLSWKND